MTVKLIIARHGNTFESDEIPTRVGARSDLPLVAKGIEQGTKIGEFLKNANLIPDIIYTSHLKRTVQTAEAALEAMGISRPLHRSDLFNEIDYGPDEGKPENEVMARLSLETYNAWDEQGIMPKEWSPQPETIRKNWQNFAKHCEDHHDDKTVLVVTSNGIARFSPEIANNAQDVAPTEKRKMSTGALSLFEGDGGLWMIAHWNHRP